MNRDDIRKLLGGYATGTLTDEERKELFAAALEDQELFNALADEEALRELLADSAYRRELAAALRESSPGALAAIAAWWRRPLRLALAGAAGALAVALLVLYPVREAPLDVALHREDAGAKLVDHKAAGAKPGDRPPAAPPATSPVKESAKARERVRAPQPQRAMDPAGAEVAAGPPERRPAPAPAPAEESDAARSPDARAAGDESRVLSASVRAKQAAPVEQAGKDEAGPAGQERAELEVAALERGAGQNEDAGRQLLVTAWRRRDVPPAAPGATRATPGFAGGIQPGAARVEHRSSDEGFEPVSAGTPLRRSETVRLRVTPPSSGYVYLIERREGAPARLIFTGEAVAGVEMPIPPAGGLPPPAEPGNVRLQLIFSRAPLELSKLGVSGAFRPEEAPASVDLVLRYID